MRLGSCQVGNSPVKLDTNAFECSTSAAIIYLCCPSELLHASVDNVATTYTKKIISCSLINVEALIKELKFSFLYLD